MWLALIAAVLAAPVAVGHHGRVLDVSGAPMEGPATIRVELFADAAGGSPVFGQNWSPVLENGYFAVTLSDNDLTGAPLDSSLFQDDTLYIATYVGGQLMGNRQPLTSTPWAVFAQTARGVPVASDSSACDEGDIRWNPDLDAIQGCESGSWVASLGTSGLSMGTFSNATVTVDDSGRITGVSAGGTLGALQTEVRTTTGANSWMTATCSSGYTLTGCVCRYTRDNTNFWPGWCEAQNTTTCRGRGYYNSTYPFQVQAICARLQ